MAAPCLLLGGSGAGDTLLHLARFLPTAKDLLCLCLAYDNCQNDGRLCWSGHFTGGGPRGPGPPHEVAPDPPTLGPRTPSLAPLLASPSDHYEAATM